jgi:hypothetical protein
VFDIVITFMVAVWKNRVRKATNYSFSQTQVLFFTIWWQTG